MPSTDDDSSGGGTRRMSASRLRAGCVADAARSVHAHFLRAHGAAQRRTPRRRSQRGAARHRRRCEELLRGQRVARVAEAGGASCATTNGMSGARSGGVGVGGGTAPAAEASPRANGREAPSVWPERRTSGPAGSVTSGRARGGRGGATAAATAATAAASTAADRADSRASCVRA